MTGRLEENVRNYWMALRKVTGFDKGSARSQSVENSLRKRLWSFRKTTAEWRNTSRLNIKKHDLCAHNCVFIVFL